MKKAGLICINMVTFLLLLGVVTAQPPGQVSQQTGFDIVTAFSEYVKAYDDFNIHIHVYNSTSGLLVNTGLSCYVHLYNHNLEGNQHISIDTMLAYGAGYNRTIPGSYLNQTGSYAVITWCNSSSAGGWFEYDFMVTSDGKPKSTEPSGIFTGLMFIPLAFAFLLLFGAFSLNEEHSAMRIFLFLLSSLMILLSLHFSLISIVNFYELPELQDVIGTTSYWMVWCVVFIVTYFIIYFVYKAFEGASKGKIERLNY